MRMADLIAQLRDRVKRGILMIEKFGVFFDSYLFVRPVRSGLLVIVLSA
jgi:hypothetical protein